MGARSRARRKGGTGGGVKDMPEPKFDQPVPDLIREEDDETLAAIDRGIKDADEGRVVSLEEAHRRVEAWLLRSSSQKKP